MDCGNCARHIKRPAAGCVQRIGNYDPKWHADDAGGVADSGDGDMNKYPYGFDTSGLTAQTDLVGHIRDMIEQILFTSPGERVNRPTFGTGTATLVFAPNSDILTAAQQQVIQASLQQWLSDLIRVLSVDVSNLDATLQISVRYTIIQTQQQQMQLFVYGGAAA
jgi:phage baseplate assembly protein W